MTNYKVIEDDGGELFLFIFDGDGNVVRGFSNLEYLPHVDFAKIIDAFNSGGDGYDLDGQLSDPAEKYEYISSNWFSNNPFGYKIVVRNDTLYPDKMGNAAKIAYGLL